jgi:DNA-binding XRE family transcriptional regulator
VTFTIALGQPIHLLVEGSTDVRCGTDDVTYVSTNADVATCPACVPDDDEPTTPAPLELEVTTPDELRAWRRRHKVSQRGLAKLLDVTGMTVLRWERGEFPITRMLGYALAYLGQRLP